MENETVIVTRLFRNSPHFVELYQFFKAIYSLTSQNFIETNHIHIDIKQSSLLSNQQLKNIHKKYKGNLTDKEMQVGAFISSLYQLPDLDVSTPKNEWLFISKLCHFLIYSVSNHLPNRIREICFIGRAWFKPGAGYKDLVTLVLSMQSDNLQTMHDNFKSEIGKQKRINDPMLNNLMKVYRILNYTYLERHQITRNSVSSTKKQIKIDKPYQGKVLLSDIDDDTDELVCITNFNKTENDIDVTRERLDDNIPDYVLLKQESIALPDKYSSQQVYRRTKSKLKHANKNDRHTLINVRGLPLFAMQDIFEKVWYLFNSDGIERKNKSAYAYILLSLLTGYSISKLSSDLYNNDKDIIVIDRTDQSYELVVQLDITPLRLRTLGIKKVIANPLMSMRIPLPNQLGAFFNYKVKANEQMVFEAIKQIKDELNLPYLSIARIQSILYTLMVHHTNSSQIASIITSRNEKNRADLWYSSHSQNEILDSYKRAITLLTKNTKGFTTDYIFKEAHLGESIGSQNSPDYPLTKAFFRYFHEKVSTSINYIEQFNAYSIWMWHLCLLLTSIRAVEGAPGYLNQFNLETGLALISDKEERATASSQRYVPLCDFLVAEIKGYLQYLDTFKQKYKWLPNGHHYGEQIDGINSSRLPILNLINKKGVFEVIRPALVRQYINQHFKFKEDWTRHVGQRYLHEKKVPESLILSVFGHEAMGQESWRKHSSISIGDILDLKIIYQSLADELELQPIRLAK